MNKGQPLIIRHRIAQMVDDAKLINDIAWGRKESPVDIDLLLRALSRTVTGLARETQP